jgi:chromosome segregation protein
VYLKRLDLHGFKTFADPTELEFTPGITAIVGPNGSGKSNVFDAIRWALGEMSFRSLRSGRMDDVIFGGTEARRGMGQAEVSLTINNDSGVLPIDYTEVTVTRRANRGGEGEYFLNDTVCRLRDIQMLFLGTGLGGRSYSLIGQGQVDGVLNAGPEERRQLLEEAAGLARYKRRCREAERRLGYATTNLLRLSDILAELTTQLEQLRAQATAATTYHAYTNEIRDLELALHVDDARRILANLKRIATQTDTVRQQRQSAAASASEVGAQMDHDRARAAEVARLWEDTQRALLQAVEDLSGRESAMQVLQERLRGTTTQRERLAHDLQRLQARVAHVEDALGGLRDQSEAQSAHRDDLLEQLRVAEERSTAAIQAQREAEHRVDALRAELTQFAAARSRTQYDLARLDAQLAALADQISGSEAKEAALTRDRAHLEGRAGEVTAALADLQQQQDAASARLAQLVERRAEIDTQLETLEGQLQQSSSERQVVMSTLSLLLDLQQQLAGYEQGAREILLAKQQDPSRFPGIRAPVAEVISVASAYRPAIEAALGRRLFSLIVSTVEDVKDGLAYLRGNGRGGVSFLPVDLMTAPSPPPVPAGREVIGRASDLVKANGMKAVAEILLGDVTVVSTLDAAVTLRRGGLTGRIVTLAGELLAPDGVVSVRGMVDGDGSLLGRKERIQSLRDRLQALEASVGDLESRRQAALCQRDALDSVIADARAAVARVQASIAEQQVVAGLLRADLDKLPIQRRELEVSRAQLAAERASLEAEAAQLREDERTIAATIAEHERGLGEAESAQRSAQEAALAAATELSNTRVQLAELGGTLDALHARIDEHIAEGAELGTRCNQVQGEITVLDGELHLLTHSLEEAQRDRQTLAGVQESTRARLTALAAERDALQQRLTDAEGRWRQLQDQIRDIEDQAHRLEVRQAQGEAELQAAQRRISEEFGAAWDDVRDVRLPLSRDEATVRIEALRGLVAALGPVNLRAVDEHQALEVRVDTLRTQADDLERAKAALGTLIQRLDQVVQVQFAATFEAVNQEFNRLFVRLFAGGRARLLLVAGDPDTEPGIEIEAQLPGKKMRSLSALSGGERVLVALSLIFAMLRVHPSPFCIFDEVEAALDDANTRKFTTLLRELAERTQVLIITHNKGTMEAADVLYGVTMETPGISRIISMRLTRPATREVAAVR